MNVVPGTGTGTFIQISKARFSSIVNLFSVHVDADGMNVVVNPGVINAAVPDEVIDIVNLEADLESSIANELG